MSAVTTPYEYATRVHGYGANVTAVGSEHKKPLHLWQHLHEQPQCETDVHALPWKQATRTGTINGIGGFRSLDIDGCTDLGIVMAILRALGLPEDYPWVEVSSGEDGFHLWIICYDDLPPGAIPATKNDPGVYVGLSKDGAFDRLELRWSRCQTIISSSDGSERWLHGRPEGAPATVSVGDVLNAFYAVASPKEQARPPETPSHRGTTHADDRQDLEDVRARFDLVAYARMKWGDVQPDGDEYRVMGHQGLLINPGKGAWYRFGDEQGGDCFDLVGFATYGEQWNRTIRQQFRTALREAAAFAGMDLHEYRRADSRELTSLRPEHVDPGPGEAIERRNLTDLGNAERLRDKFGARIRHCAALDAWLIWDGTRWKRDEQREIHHLGAETVRAIYADAADGETLQEREAIAKHATKSEAVARIEAMISLARSFPEIAILASDLDSDRWALNCLNGTLDLRTGTLRAHNPADLLTKRCPVAYDANATLPLWDWFITETTGGNEDFAGFLRRIAGYTLQGDPSEEVIVFPHGPGATGKSTLLEAFKAVLGDYALTADFEAFLKKRGDGGIRTDIARLAGARFVVSIEVDDGKRLAEGLIKTISGGDTVTARHLYQKSFEYHPDFTLWLAANHAPKVNPDDDAMWRRILRLPFTHIVPKEKRDPQVKATLRDPAIAGAAILAWAVRGCLEWQRDGLGVPEVVENATETYRREMNPFADFVDGCCEFSPQAWTATERIWNAYRQHEGDDPNVGEVAKKAFVAHLQSLGCTPASQRWQGKVTRGWKGIALKDDDTPRGDALSVDGVDGVTSVSRNFLHESLHKRELRNSASTPSTPSTETQETSSDEGLPDPARPLAADDLPDRVALRKWADDEALGWENTTFPEEAIREATRRYYALTIPEGSPRKEVADLIVAAMKGLPQTKGGAQ